MAEVPMEPVPTPSPGANRALKAIQLQEAGYQPDEIAEALGYDSTEEVAVRLQKDYKELAKNLPADKEQVRQLFRRRMDRLIRAVWTKAIDPTHPEQLIAVQRVMQILDREAKLLGIDAPTEIDVTVSRSQEELQSIASAIIAMKHDLPETEDDILEAEVVYELEEEMRDDGAA